MLSSIILNSKNIVNDGYNNKLKYSFPTPVEFKKNGITVAGLDVFYSWFNISNDYANNVFSYRWFDNTGTGYTTYSVLIPDGFYDVKSLNAYLQSVFISNKHYVVDQSNKKIFLLEMVTNPTYYACQLNAYAINNTYLTSMNWTVPAGATWTIGATILMPQFIIQSNAFRDVIGFDAGVYPVVGSPVTGVINSVKSTYCPEVSPVNSLILRCNLLSSKYCNPNDILTSFPINASFGSIVSFHPNSTNFINIRDGIYNEILITICDQNYNPIKIIDPSMVVQLLIQ